jgi:hypothetical protein
VRLSLGCFCGLVDSNVRVMLKMASVDVEVSASLRRAEREMDDVRAGMMDRLDRKSRRSTFLEFVDAGGQLRPWNAGWG